MDFESIASTNFATPAWELLAVPGAAGCAGLAYLAPIACEPQQSWGRKNTRPAFAMLQELFSAVTMPRNVAS
jgi:hypothetical protein